MNYKCINCNIFNTKNLKDIIRHSNTKKKCIQSLESLDYSKDQILFLSLLPTNIDISKNELDFLKDISILDNNREELINIIIENTTKKNCKHCKYCNKIFENNIYLRKHIILECFIDIINKKNKNIKINIINKDSYNTTNITNIPINITQNITLEIKSPIPFDEDWNIKNLSEDEKIALLHSMKMYTNFLKKILENDENLNVIVDKEIAYVYDNDNEKYIKMNLPEVFDKTMDKINKQLNDINNANEEMIKESLNLSKKHIKEKFDKYKSDNSLKIRVNEILNNIYEEKKDDAIKISKKIIENFDKGDGY
jgi:hypothetical protein